MALTLHVDIDADTRELKTAVQGAERQVEHFGKEAEQAGRRTDRALLRMRRSFANVTRGIGRNIASVAKSFVSFNAVLGVAAGAAGLGLLVKRSIDFGDEIAKTADKVGLSTDALQELRIAAGLAGVETATADMALQRFSRRTGEAAQGTGELLGVVERYNIQLRDSEGRQRALEDVLADYADIVANAESEQEQLRLAFKAFDSEGAALVNLLREGSVGMDRMRARARSLGLVIDKDLLRSAEGAKDQLSLLGQVISTKVTAGILELAPRIDELTERFIEGLPVLFDYTEQFGVWIGLLEKNPADRLRELSEEIAALNKEVGAVEFLGIEIRGRRTVGAEIDRLKELLAERRELQRELGLLPPFARATGGGALPPPPRPSPGSPPPGQEVAAAFREPSRTLGRMLSPPAQRLQLEGRAAELAAIHLGALNDQRERAASLVESLRTPQEQYNDTLAEYDELLSKGLLTTGEYARAVAAAKDELKAAREEQEAANEELAEQQAKAEDAARRFGFTFASAFEDAVIAGNSLSDVFQGLIEDIQRMILRLLVIEPLARDLGALFSGLVPQPSAGGGGQLTSLFGGIDSLFSSSSGGGGFIGPEHGFASRALGGPVRAGELYETHGLGRREFFFPQVDGHIATTNQIGGGGNTYNIDARGADRAGIEDLKRVLVRELGPGRIEERAVRGVVDARRRDPRLFGGAN